MRRLLALFIVVMLLLAGCTTTIVSFRVMISGDTKVATGGGVMLRAGANTPSYVLKWSATAGKVMDIGNDKAIWEAPTLANNQAVMVTATSSGGAETSATAFIEVRQAPVTVLEWTNGSDVMGAYAQVRLRNDGSDKVVKCLVCGLTRANATYQEKLCRLAVASALPADTFTVRWDLPASADWARFWVEEVYYDKASTWKL